jgi:hypothetical protein
MLLVGFIVGGLDPSMMIVLSRGGPKEKSVDQLMGRLEVYLGPDLLGPNGKMLGGLSILLGPVVLAYGIIFGLGK